MSVMAVERRASEAVVVGPSEVKDKEQFKAFIGDLKNLGCAMSSQVKQPVETLFHPNPCR